MKLKIIFAIFACKLTRFVLRVFRRGGTALPGQVAVRICPDLLRHLSKGVVCVVITGTNGKTTSARMLEQFFIDARKSYFTNKSGSNLLRGITGEFVYNATAAGKPRRKYAVIECDEAASKKVFEYINPRVVLVTNVFSDQLDRYGTIAAVLENIQTGVKNAPNAVVCLNADDSLTSSIADEIPNRVVYYGGDAGRLDHRADELSDASRCIRCGATYEYDYTTYAHLGGFRCPSCGYARKKTDVVVTGVKARDADSQTVIMRVFDKTSDITINLPGDYNIYNAAGATAAATGFGFSIEEAKDALLRFECGFGRMEKLELNGLPVRIILVKNAAGCNQALSYLTSLTGDALIAICLNDRIADGTDVSWIKDARFERLTGMGGRIRGILVSGTRAGDMAERLKDAGLPDAQIRLCRDPGEVLETALAQDAPVYILPTYTAMLELRDKICRDFGLKHYWE
ncbi:MAG: MurT ligase domain-containing protein [Oscillospiraceae bacterium]|nr:MurT ligase domain-containing protein [Oscillospiraceae bacterium]